MRSKSGFTNLSVRASATENLFCVTLFTTIDTPFLFDDKNLMLAEPFTSSVLTSILAGFPTLRSSFTLTSHPSKLYIESFIMRLSSFFRALEKSSESSYSFAYFLSSLLTDSGK